MKRFLSAALSACLMLSMLAGCGDKNEQADTPMGRYIEEQGPSLEGAGMTAGLHRAENGDIIFYTKEVGDKDAYYRCVLPAGGGALQKAEAAWIGDFLQAEQGELKTLSEAADGTVYLLYYTADFQTAIARGRAGGAAEKLEIAELKARASKILDGNSISMGGGNVSISGGVAPAGEMETGGEPGQDGAAAEPEGEGGGGEAAMSPGVSFSVQSDGASASAKFANGVLALDDGFLVQFGNAGIYRYNSDGVKTAEYLGTAYGTNAAVYGNTLLMSDTEGKGIVSYDMDSAKPSGSYTYESQDFFPCLGMDEKGIYLADSSGVYRQAEGGTIWEKQVDGSLTSLVMPNIGLSGICSDGTGGYYAILSVQDGGVQMVHYRYDAETPTNPDTELTIFSLKDNATVRQAIGEFQRRNPSVRVNFRVAMGDDSAATVEDVIRSLNTEILGGKGPDILLLDGLPVDSYMEKNVLADLSGLVSKLEGEGLMGNLMGAYQKDGKIYGIPSRFTLPVMLGSGGDLDGLTSLEDLAGRLERDAGAEPPLLWGPDELWKEDGTGLLMKYYDAYADTFLQDGRVDQAALERYFAAVSRIDQAVKAYTPQLGDGMASITIAVAVSSSGGFESMDAGAYQLSMGKARMHIQQLSGVYSLQNIQESLRELEGYRMESLFGKNLYTPVGGVGILNGGKQKELATSFLEMLLSRTVQDSYLYDGFAVNSASLELMVNSASLELTVDGAADAAGGRTEQENAEFLALCKNLSTPTLVDSVVKEAAQAQARDLLAGKVTPAQAAANVVEKTQLYLAE